jgi:hypothetical protein
LTNDLEVTGEIRCPIFFEAIRSIGQIRIYNLEVQEFLSSFESNENPQIKKALKITKSSFNIK